LVAKLLNYSKNPQADLYNKVFSKQDKQLIRAMKLEQFISSQSTSNGGSTTVGSRLYATEAMSLLETYITKNPKINDIRLLMNDDSACDKYKRWSTVKKNYRDFSSLAGDRKISNNSFLPRASFRRSKIDSFFSGHSVEADEELLKGKTGQPELA
jgi:hypothetical protein